MLDSIADSTSVRFYYYNGVANSKHMEIYAPEAKLFRRTEVDMTGTTHQILSLSFLYRLRLQTSLSILRRHSRQMLMLMQRTQR